MAALAAMALAGCGSEADYANEPRPPLPINLSAAITEDRITVDPKQFGAGPVVLIIANQTPDPHRVTIESDQLGASSPGLKQTTSPINPQGTATLKLDMAEGRYDVTVDGGVEGTKLKVGDERPPSSDQLLTP